MRMSPKIDIVTKEIASKTKLIFGVQIGFWGIILRIGLYK